MALIHKPGKKSDASDAAPVVVTVVAADSVSAVSGAFFSGLSAFASLFRPRVVSTKIPPISRNCLAKIHRLSFQALAKMHHAVRKVEKEDAARRILRHGLDGAGPTCWRQFALMMNPGMIRETSLEGGPIHESVQAAQHFVRRCLQGSGIFFEVGIPEQVFRVLDFSLENFRDFLQFYDLAQDGVPIAPAERVAGEARRFLEAIQKTFSSLPKEFRILYLPIGYAAGPCNQGHSMACKLAEEERHVVISIFNLGNGTDIHPILNYTLNHKKRSFAFFPIRVPKEVFYGEVGLTAFAQLLRYRSDTPLHHSPFDGNDIYDILLQFVGFENGGEVVLDLGPNQAEYEAQEQLSGNCPEVALRCVTEDVLITCGIPKRERDRFFLNRDFCALMSAYHAFREDPGGHPAARDLLHDAAQSFGTLILDLYRQKQLTEAEFTGAQAVIHEIVTVASTVIPVKVAARRQHAGAAEAVSFEFPLLPSLMRPSPSISVVEAPSSLRPRRIIPPRFERAQIGSFPAVLKQWIEVAAYLPENDAFAFVCDCVATLPIPLRTDKEASPIGASAAAAVVDIRVEAVQDIWDEIPGPRINDLIDGLVALMKTGIRGIHAAPISHYSMICGDRRSMSRRFKDQFLTIYSVYAICDKLARNCKDSCLENYQSPFLPHAFSFEPYGFTSLPLAEDNRRYTQLFQYFTGKKRFTDRGDQAKVIFPIAPLLPVGLFVEDRLAGKQCRETEQGQNHLDYLVQFFPGIGNCNILLTADHARAFQSQWMSALPPQVQSLYYLVFLSHCLFFAPECALPDQLVFTEVEISGRRGLRIEEPFFSKQATARPPSSPFFNKNLQPVFDQPVQDERFQEFGIKPVDKMSNVVPFIEVFSPSVRKLTTNEIVCYPLAERDRAHWKISEADVRAVLYMLRRPSLGFWQAIQVISQPENLPLLDHHGVQQALDACFFQPRFLLERLEQEPGPAIRAFRRFVKEGLGHFNNNVMQLNSILFLLRIGICFESFTPDSPSRNGIFSLYRESMDALMQRPLSDSQRQIIALHVMLLETSREQDDPRFLFGLLFKASTTSFAVLDEARWVGDRVWSQIRENGYKYYHLLESPQYRDAICGAILREAIDDQEFLQQGPFVEWQGEFPQYEHGDVCINFFTGRISHRRHQGVLIKEDLSRYDDEMSDALKKKHGCFFWRSSDGGKLSLNGKLRFCPVSHEWREIVAGPTGAQVECAVHSFPVREIEAHDQDFLNWYKYLPWIHYTDHSGVITTYDQTTGRPYLRIETRHKALTYTRLDEEGRPLPYQLVNLSRLKPSHPLHQYTVRFMYPDQMLCFVKAGVDVGQSGRIELDDIVEINFYRSNQRFVNDGRGLASSQFPGYYLVACKEDLAFGEAQAVVKAKTTREVLVKEAGESPFAQRALDYLDLCTIHEGLQDEMNGLSFALVLLNRETKRWMIFLPKASLSQEAGDFTRDVRYSSRQATTEYYCYTYDPIEKSLAVKGDNVDEAYGYLTRVFKMQRDYDKAFKYMKGVRMSHDLKSTMYEILWPFTQSRDHSIASIAFDLKLFLLFVRNLNLMFEGRFKRKTNHELFDNFFLWAMRNYQAFLSATTETGLNPVPEHLALSDEEKKILLLSFRAFYKRRYEDYHLGWEELFKREQPLLDTQYHVYFAPTRKNAVRVRPQKVALHPPIFSNVAMADKISFYSLEQMVNRYRELHAAPPDSSDRRAAVVPDFPIQVTLDAVEFNFFKLYETARRCPPNVLGPFDFCLQAILKTKERHAYSSNQSSSIGSVLFWVRHFSDLFSYDEYSFPDVSLANLDDCFPVLERIHKRLASLKETHSDRYVRFRDRFLGAEHSFVIDRDIHLSAPRLQQEVIAIEFAPTEHPGNLRARLAAMEERMHAIFDTPYEIRGGQLTEAEAEQEVCFALQQDTSQTLVVPVAKGQPRVGGRGPLASFGLLPEVLMKEVILKNNMSFLRRHRPMLTISQMNKLCWCVNEWYYARVLLRHFEDGTMAQHVPYDPQKYPEVSYFSLMTGKSLRARQLETFIWVSEGFRKGSHRYFQLPAGHGKTDVVNPMLNLAAKRWGLMPVTCVTQAIYPVDKENLSFNLGVLNESLCFLEVGMHMINTLTGENLEFIYSQLRQYWREGMSLIMMRHTYDAIFLIHDKSCYDSIHADKADVQGQIQRGARIRWAHKILTFFNTECALICDEAHENMNPMTRAIYGVGEFLTIPADESAFLLALMKPLLGHYPAARVACNDGRDVAAIIPLTKDLSAVPSPADLKAVQEALARAYLAQFFPDLHPEIADAFFVYWTNETAPQPEILRKWWSSGEADMMKRSRLAVLASHFLIILLPDLARMRTEVDHCRSLYTQRRHDVPAHNKLPSTAEFDDRYRTCATTIKGAYARGLRNDDLREVLVYMIKLSGDEQRRGFRPHEAPTNKIFTSWLADLPGDSMLRGLSLDSLSLSNEGMMKDLLLHLRYHPQALEYFLFKYGFEGIGAPEGQLSCTTTDVFSGFNSTCLYTATPPHDLANPHAIRPQDYARDRDFENDVVAQMQAPSNRRKIVIPDGADFFDIAMEQYKPILEEATVLIDPRWFFSGITNEELVQMWMKYNQSLDGVFYWSEDRSTKVNREEQICLRLRDGKVLKFEGSNIKKALSEQHNLNWDALKLGTLYDPARTASANILQKPDATACFFVGEGLTDEHAVQAVMRLRGFLDLDQRVIWVYREGLARKVFSTAECDFAECLAWMRRNGLEEVKKKIIVNALQEIQHRISREARRELADAHSRDKTPGMDLVVAAYRKNAEGLVERLPRNIYEAFADHEIPQDTSVVLNEFARRLYHRFNYAQPYDANDALRQDIERIIGRVRAEIAEIPANFHQSASKHIEHHMQFRTKVEREQRNECPRPIEPYALDGRYGDVKIYDPRYLNILDLLAMRVLKNGFLSEDLFFTRNFIRTGKLKDMDEQSCQILKPIHFFVIVITRKESGEYVFRAVAETNEILSSQLDQLMECPDEVAGLRHTAFLVSAQDDLVQKGRGAIAPPDQLVDSVMGSRWMTDLVIDAALLQGKIRNPERLLERIKRTGWDEFQVLWTKILDMLPNRETAQDEAFQALKKAYFQGLQASAGAGVVVLDS